MKIGRLFIKNFLGIQELDEELDELVAVLGPNWTGKSSIAQAIRFALDCSTDRVRLKGDFHKLVHQGAKRASVGLKIGENTIKRNVRDGKVIGKPEMPQWPWDVILGIERFGQLRADVRRRMIISSSDASLDIEKVGRTLTKRGVRESLRADLVPLVKASFDEAHEAAVDTARSLKGEWRGITGETWGSGKGEEWEPETVQQTDDDSKALSAMIDAVTKEMDEAKAKFSEANSAMKRWEMISKLRNLADHDKLDEAKEMVESAKGELREAELRKEAAEGQFRAAEAAAALEREAMTCPKCNTTLVVRSRGLCLPESTPAKPPSSMDEISARFGKAKAAVTQHAKRLKAAEGEVAAIESAIAQVDKLAEGDGGKVPTQDEVTALDAKVANLQAKEGTLRGRLHAAMVKEAKVKALEGDAERAADIHQQIVEALTAAELLGPSGIPMKMAERALRKVNELLTAYCAHAGWPAVSVGDDMEVRFGGREYTLCSEAQQWLCDSLAAIAISVTCGARFIVLDRCDVLVAAERAKLFKLVMALIDPPASASPAEAANRLEQAILIASTPKRPKLPGGIQVIWRGD